MVDFRSRLTPQNKRILLQGEVADDPPVQILSSRELYCGDFIIHHGLQDSSLVVTVGAIKIMAALCRIKSLIARSDECNKSGSKRYRNEILIFRGDYSQAVTRRAFKPSDCPSLIVFFYERLFLILARSRAKKHPSFIQYSIYPSILCNNAKSSRCQ